jgi:hypothetical protein
MLQATLQNPNQAQWLYGDPTFNVRYITPDVDTFSSAKYDEVRGHLQELLPNCFWSGEDGSFANSSTSLMSLQDEVDACNDAFDEDFFRVIYERAAERDPRIAKKATNPPMHDRNALRDKFQWFQSMSNLYANGGLDVRTLVEEHGYDYEDIKQRLKDQQADVKKGYFMPAFEPKQGIVTGVLEKVGVIESSANEPTVPKTPLGQLSDGSTLHISPPPAGAKKPAASATAPKKRTRTRKKADGGKGGRPTKVGATRPQPETNSTRAPRPNTGGK